MDGTVRYLNLLLIGTEFMRLPSRGFMAAAACGLVFVQFACTSPSEPGTTAPAVSATTAAGVVSAVEPSSRSSEEPESGNPILAGERRIGIATAEEGKQASLAVKKDGKLIADDAGAAPETLFVLKPAQGKHQIQIVEADGDRSCLGLSGKRTNVSFSEATVVAAPCATSREGQLWTVKKDEYFYYLHSGELYLGTSGESGLVAREQGEGLPDPALFTFTDKGGASCRPCVAAAEVIRVCQAGGQRALHAQASGGPSRQGVGLDGTGEERRDHLAGGRWLRSRPTQSRVSTTASSHLCTDRYRRAIRWLKTD